MLVIILFFFKVVYFDKRKGKQIFSYFVFLDYMDVFMFVNVLELYKIIYYLIQWLYVGRWEINVIYYYLNIDFCEIIKVYDYMYVKRMN